MSTGPNDGSQQPNTSSSHPNAQPPQAPAQDAAQPPQSPAQNAGQPQQSTPSNPPRQEITRRNTPRSAASNNIFAIILNMIPTKATFFKAVNPGLQPATMGGFLDHVESRDKLCRAIQYGSKFISGEQAQGIAHDIDVSTGLARKVFRLLKSINELEALSASSHGGLPLIQMVSNSKHLLMATYFALDNLVWAGRMGIYKSKWHADSLANLSLYCFMGGSACDALVELHNLVSHASKYKQSAEEKKKVHEGAIGFIRSSLDIIVAIGLLHLAQKRVTPRVTGALGFLSSLITCYQLFLQSAHGPNKIHAH